MNDSRATDAFLINLLHRLMSRHGGAQIFLFSGKGDPFWAARTPLKQMELTMLREALDFIESMEADHPKPFMARHPSGRFTVAALDHREELYVVVFGDGADHAVAEARVVAIRSALVRGVEAVPELRLRH